MLVEINEWLVAVYCCYNQDGTGVSLESVAKVISGR